MKETGEEIYRRVFDTNQIIIKIGEKFTDFFMFWIIYSIVLVAFILNIFFSSIYGEDIQNIFILFLFFPIFRYFFQEFFSWEYHGIEEKILTGLFVFLLFDILFLSEIFPTLDTYILFWGCVVLLGIQFFSNLRQLWNEK